MEIICYVETEVPAVRWNHDGSMFMTEDYRWYPSNGALEESGIPANWVTPKVGGRVADGYAARRAMAKVLPANMVRHCDGCGKPMGHTGKRGRPAKKCDACRTPKTTAKPETFLTQARYVTVGDVLIIKGNRQTVTSVKSWKDGIVGFNFRTADSIMIPANTAVEMVRSANKN